MTRIASRLLASINLGMEVARRRQPHVSARTDPATIVDRASIKASSMNRSAELIVHKGWSRLQRATAIVGSGVALAATLMASPALAATTGQMSTVVGGCSGVDVGIQISGSTDHTYSITRSFKVELWGSDSFSDDFLISYKWAPLSPFPVSGVTAYFSGACISPSTLDEDWGTDEVYAKVFFYNSTNATGSAVESVRTNELNFNF
jgi:hypothetical protein